VSDPKDVIDVWVKFKIDARPEQLNAALAILNSRNYRISDCGQVPEQYHWVIVQIPRADISEILRMLGRHSCVLRSQILAHPLPYYVDVGGTNPDR
jgi:hypothetical protein